MASNLMAGRLRSTPPVKLPPDASVLLYGLGAIGSFYAFILDRTQRVQLSVVARSNYDAVTQNGLHIRSANHGNHVVRPFKVLKRPAEAAQTVDYVVCTNKATDLAATARHIAPVVADRDTCIVLIQNGVGNEDPFRKAFPHNSILSCVTWVGASQETPGVVEHWPNEDTKIGLFRNDAVDASLEEARLDRFTALLRDGGTPFSVEPDIQLRRWEKIVWNVAWNSLTTLTMLDTLAWLRSSPAAIPMTRALMREVIDVARAIGLPLEYALVDELLAKILAMQPIGSSMQTDCKRGMPMEVDVILGTPVRRARELGVPTPTLDTLHTLLVAIDGRMKHE